MTECKFCGEQIDFERAESGKWTPTNKDGSSHFGTCPNYKKGNHTYFRGDEEVKEQTDLKKFLGEE